MHNAVISNKSFKWRYTYHLDTLQKKNKWRILVKNTCAAHPYQLWHATISTEAFDYWNLERCMSLFSLFWISSLSSICALSFSCLYVHSAQFLLSLCNYYTSSILVNQLYKQQFSCSALLWLPFKGRPVFQSDRLLPKDTGQLFARISHTFFTSTAAA